MDSQVGVALGLSLVGGMSTSLGALIVVLNQAPNLKMLGLLQGFAAGLMLSISFFDLTHNALNRIGFLKGNIWFFAGVSLFALIVNFIPEPSFIPSPEKKSKKDDDGANKDLMKRHRRQVFFSGIITSIGISLHNFPEGMAVFLGSIKGLRVGINLALAIALHNIPEGVAVALPVYFATESKWESFKLATLSGFAEPFGVIIVAFLFPTSLNPEILEGLLGSVGGVMAFLTLHEMLPLAFDYAGQKQAVKAVFLGMAFMSSRLLGPALPLARDQPAISCFDGARWFSFTILGEKIILPVGKGSNEDLVIGSILHLVWKLPPGAYTILFESFRFSSSANGEGVLHLFGCCNFTQGAFHSLQLGSSPHTLEGIHSFSLEGSDSAVIARIVFLRTIRLLCNSVIFEDKAVSVVSFCEGYSSLCKFWEVG